MVGEGEDKNEVSSTMMSMRRLGGREEKGERKESEDETVTVARRRLRALGVPIQGTQQGAEKRW